MSQDYPVKEKKNQLYYVNILLKKTVSKIYEYHLLFNSIVLCRKTFPEK